jgi:hypothetical protein
MNNRDPCCEACRLAPQETGIEENDPRWPYRLCQVCAQRLKTYSLRPALLQARQGRDLEGLSGRASWPHKHAQGAVQRRPTGLHQGIGLASHSTR